MAKFPWLSLHLIHHLTFSAGKTLIPPRCFSPIVILVLGVHMSLRLLQSRERKKRFAAVPHLHPPKPSHEREKKQAQNSAREPVIHQPTPNSKWWLLPAQLGPRWHRCYGSCQAATKSRICKLCRGRTIINSMCFFLFVYCLAESNVFRDSKSYFRNITNRPLCICVLAQAGKCSLYAIL